MSLRAVDPRFLLPTQPGTASFIGDPVGWRAGLNGIGVEVLDVADGGTPDLVVAAASDVAAALDIGAAHWLFLGGDVTREVRSYGLKAEAYLAVPDLQAPEYLVPVAQASTVRYFYDVVRVAPTRARWYRNRVAARAATGLTRYLAGSRMVTVVGAELGCPFGVAAAAEAGRFEPGGWLLSLGQVTADRRVVFSVFEGKSPSPRVVVKLDRQPRGTGEPAPDDPKVLWLADLAARGPLFGEHVPHPVADLSCGGGRVTVETAAVGYLLSDFLRGPFTRRRKVQALEVVASWLVTVAGDTAHSKPVRRMTATDGTYVDRPGLDVPIAPVPRVPLVLEHGDLWSGNVVYRSARTFTVIDWADADRDGLPLRDLLYFLSDTLALVDGTTTDSGRDRHFVELFRGELPSSALLFRWVRALVDALDIDPESVSSLASRCWDESAARRRDSMAGETDHTEECSGPKANEPVIRRAELWKRDPQLGGGWTAWNA